MDINLLAYQYFEGVDLLAIEGVSHATHLSLMSEVGQKALKNLHQPSSLPVGSDWLPIIE